jgi:hypothetical protein
VDSPLGNPPQLRPAVIGGAINLAVSQHSFRLSLTQHHSESSVGYASRTISRPFRH